MCYLGYDRDDLGCYFLGREAFELAESQFRRAVWLNPYEPVFKIHWAVALTHLNRMREAHDLLVGVFRNRQDNALARQLWHHFWPAEPLPVPEPASSDLGKVDPATQDPAREAECRDPPC